MVYGFGNSCVKLLFFIVNLLICICGGLICGFSLWANLDRNFSEHLDEFVRKIDAGSTEHINEIAKYQASLWILVGVGALLFFVGFLGCCGAACESPVLLGLFFFVIVILTAIELGATVFAMTNRAEFLTSIETVMTKSAGSPDFRRNLKPIQDVLNCCGATQMTQHLYIDEKLCGEHPVAIDCFGRIEKMVDSANESIIVCGFVLLAIELFALLFSCVLCRASRETRYSSYYA